MSRSIANDYGFKTEFVTHTFGKVRIGVLAAFGLSGLTLIVVGLLALFHMHTILVLPGLGGLSNQAIFALIGVGASISGLNLFHMFITGIDRFALITKAEFALAQDLSLRSHNASILHEELASFDANGAGLVDPTLTYDERSIYLSAYRNENGEKILEVSLFN